MTQKLKRRSYLRQHAMGVAALALAACGPAPAADPVPAPAGTAVRPALRIGVILPFTGPFAASGEDQWNGMELYLQKIGRTMAGRRVEVIKEDSEGKPDVTLRKTRKVVEQDNVDVIAGIFSSAEGLGIRDYVDGAKVITIITNAGANDLTRSRKSPYLFRTAFSNWQWAYPAGPWTAKNVGKKVWTVAGDYAAGREMQAAFAAGLAKEGGVVENTLWTGQGTSDFQPLLTQVRQARPDVVWSFFGGADVLRYVKQYDEFGLLKEIPLVGPAPLTAADVLPELGPSGLGVRTNTPYTAELDTPENKEFVATWRRAFNRDPSAFSVGGYEGMQFLAAALQTAAGNTADKDKLIKALEGTRFNSPRGALQMDAETHNVAGKSYMVEVVDVGAGKMGQKVLADLGTFKDPGS